MGILDKIIDTHQQQSLEQFELRSIISKILEPLKEREKVILAKRYGLQGNSVSTLKAVGQEQGLTRERVRQIEKELLKNLKRSIQNEKSFNTAKDLMMTTIMEHGGAMSEAQLLDFLNVENEEETNAVKFILGLIPELETIQEEDGIRASWAGVGFNKQLLKEFIAETKKLFGNHGKPLTAEQFMGKFKQLDLYTQNHLELHDKALLSYLHTVGEIDTNVFGEFGLYNWEEINPKDVGDKAYVLMKHHKKPEHYSVITELINKNGFDKRIAYKETVHNKLIKDKRFVLVGRGMYALVEWGYKPGVVSDIITEVLKEKGEPLLRDEIIAEVLKRRLVKKNTILVGLSNKQLFKKVGKNTYALVD